MSFILKELSVFVARIEAVFSWRIGIIVPVISCYLKLEDELKAGRVAQNP